MSIDPLLPGWLVLVLAAAAAWSAWSAYRRPSWPAALRAAAIVLLSVMLANPVRIETASTVEPPVLALVVDRSASMATADAAQGATRLAGAITALETLATRLEGRYRIQRFALGEQVQPGFATQADGDTAYDDLARFAQSAPAAVVLASDGGDRGTTVPDGMLGAAIIPVFAIAVGSPAPAANVAVRLEPASPSVFPGQEMTLDAVITASGTALGKPSEVVLFDGDGAELARRTLIIASEVRETFTVAAGEAPGERVWQVRVQALTGEATTADNEATGVVQVVDRALRIAVVEGQPYWDTSFAVRAWRRDRQLAVGTLYGVGQRRWKTGTATIDPPTAEALAQVDIIVIGSHSERLIEAAGVTAITNFVTDGGGLLFLGVSDDAAGAPLAALDPLVRRAGRSPAVVPALTDGGRQLALLPTGGKPLASVVSGLIAGLRPRSEVLVGVEEQPLVVRRRHGAGRVATVNAEGLWRWSLGADGDGEVAARFWRQLIKSLAREGQAGLQADRPRYRAGQEAVLTAAGDEVLVLSAPDGRQTSLPRGDGSVRVTLAVAGRWTVTQGARRLTLPVEADVREVTDVARRDERLARLAGATGGVVVEADAAASLADRLARRADLRVAAPRNIPLITSPWWLLLFTGLLAVEWWLRRRRHGAI